MLTALLFLAGCASNNPNQPPGTRLGFAADMILSAYQTGLKTIVEHPETPINEKREFVTKLDSSLKGDSLAALPAGERKRLEWEMDRAKERALQQIDAARNNYPAK